MEMRYTSGLSCKICPQVLTVDEENKLISRGNRQVEWLTTGFNDKPRKEVSESAISLTKQKNASGIVNFQWMDFTKRVKRFSNFTDVTGTGINVI